jgi:hypothetical protein
MLGQAAPHYRLRPLKALEIQSALADDPADVWEDCPFLNRTYGRSRALGWGGVDGLPPHPLWGPPEAANFWHVNPLEDVNPLDELDLDDEDWAAIAGTAHLTRDWLRCRPWRAAATHVGALADLQDRASTLVARFLSGAVLPGGE